MLAYILAIAIGLSSLALFLAAFFRPKLHRQDDFLWSGIGLFYALILWLCSEQLRGAVLLGHVAGVVLVLTFGWQTLKLRLALANPEARAEIESFSLLVWMQSRLGSSIPKKQPSPPIPKTEKVAAPTATEQPVQEVAQTSPPVATQEIEEIEKPETLEPTAEAVEPKTVSTPIEEITVKPKTSLRSKPETPTKSGFSFNKLFGFGKSKSVPKPSPTKPETLTAALDLSDEAESDEFEEDAIASGDAPSEIAPQNTASTEVTPMPTEAEIIKVEAYIEDEKTETVIEAERVTVDKATETLVNSEEITAEIEPSPADDSLAANKKDAPENTSSSEFSNPVKENQNQAENPPHSPEI